MKVNPWTLSVMSELPVTRNETETTTCLFCMISGLSFLFDALSINEPRNIRIITGETRSKCPAAAVGAIS